jgi:hypothetical protein
MTRTSQVLLVLAAVLVVGTVAAVFVGERTERTPERASTAAATPAPDYSAASRTAMAVALPAGSAERNRGLALEIEVALISRDASRLEAAFATALPQLIAADAGNVAAIFARQQPGETRVLLRDEIARQWVRYDRDSAIAWMKSLDDLTERKAAATTAMYSIAASDPAQAVIVSDELDVGRDDGSIEHIVQMWAASDPTAAQRWLESQPAGDARHAQLRARIEAGRGAGTAPD